MIKLDSAPHLNRLYDTNDLYNTNIPLNTWKKPQKNKMFMIGFGNLSEVEIPEVAQLLFDAWEPYLLDMKTS